MINIKELLYTTFLATLSGVVWTTLDVPIQEPTPYEIAPGQRWYVQLPNTTLVDDLYVSSVTDKTVELINEYDMKERYLREDVNFVEVVE